MNKTDKKGFTIIEVVVVLAIAGLIFAIVFWAIPNLQKSNRDNTRRTIVGNIVANLDQFAANNDGKYPCDGTAVAPNCVSTFTVFITAPTPPATGYFTDGIVDPLGGTMTHAGAATTVPTTQTQIAYRLGYRCDPNNDAAMQVSSGTRSYAIIVKLEQGIAYCADNN